MQLQLVGYAGNRAESTKTKTANGQIEGALVADVAIEPKDVMICFSSSDREFVDFLKGAVECHMVKCIATYGILQVLLSTVEFQFGLIMQLIELLLELQAKQLWPLRYTFR